MREAYRFRKERLHLTEQAEVLAERISDSPAVSVHVRRGDYLDASHGGMYTGICTEGYYQKAMERIRKSVPDAVFYVFSNDTDWAKAHFVEKDCVVAEGGTEDTGYQDMYLMSLCQASHHRQQQLQLVGRHGLEEIRGKKVIAPDRWPEPGTECRDIYTENMIRL